MKDDIEIIRTGSPLGPLQLEFHGEALAACRLVATPPDPPDKPRSDAAKRTLRELAKYFSGTGRKFSVRLAPAGTAPEEKVDGRKRQRIGAAALKFLNQSGSDREVFFDVVTVLFDGDRTEVSYFPQAWIPMYV